LSGWYTAATGFAFVFRMIDQRRYERDLPWKEPPFFVKGASKAITLAGPTASRLRRWSAGRKTQISLRADRAESEKGAAPVDSNRSRAVSS
jgi:hypothetical protein